MKFGCWTQGSEYCGKMRGRWGIDKCWFKNKKKKKVLPSITCSERKQKLSSGCQEVTSRFGLWFLVEEVWSRSPGCSLLLLLGLSCVSPLHHVPFLGQAAVSTWGIFSRGTERTWPWSWSWVWCLQEMMYANRTKMNFNMVWTVSAGRWHGNQSSSLRKEFWWWRSVFSEKWGWRYLFQKAP